MIGYVWRVPTVLGITACSALTLFAALVIASIVVRRCKSVITAVGAIVTLACLAIAALMAVRTTASRIADSLDIDVNYVDPGFIGYLAPLMFAAFAFVTGERLLEHRWTDRRALWFSAWVFVFTALNAVNYCSPGWCETIGVPFPWLAWSDSILTFSDPDPLQDLIDTAAPAMAALLDLGVFVAIARALTRRRPPEIVRAEPTSSRTGWRKQCAVPIWIVVLGALGLSVGYTMASVIGVADPLRADIQAVVSRIEPSREHGSLMTVCGPPTGVALGMQLGLLGLLAGGIPAAILAMAFAARQRTCPHVWSGGWGTVFQAGFVFQLCSVLFATTLLFLMLLADLDWASEAQEMFWWGTVLLLICICGRGALPSWRRLQHSSPELPVTIMPRVPADDGGAAGHL